MTFAYYCGQDANLAYSRAASRAEKSLAVTSFLADPPSKELLLPFTPTEWFATMTSPAFFLRSGYNEACVAWPTPAELDPLVPPGAAYPSIPTLILAGGLDRVTTVADAEVIASRFPNSRLLALPFVNHYTSFWSPCAAAFARDFIDSATLPASRGTCAGAHAFALRRYPASIAEVAPLASATATSTQSQWIRAVSLTVVDVAVRRMTGVSVYLNLDNFDGLRGGTATWTKLADGAQKVALQDYAWINGIALTGELTRAADGALAGTVTVAAAAGAPSQVSMQVDPLEQLESANNNVTANFGAQSVQMKLPVWDDPDVP